MFIVISVVIMMFQFWLWPYLMKNILTISLSIKPFTMKYLLLYLGIFLVSVRSYLEIISYTF